VAGPEAETPDDDSGSLKNRIYGLLKLGAKIGTKATQYGGVVIPVGDGISAFLSDVTGSLQKREDDKQAAADTAKAMTGIFQHMLGTADDPSTPGLTTACNDDTKANYTSGLGVRSGLTVVLNNLVQNGVVDTGVKDGTDLSALSPADAKVLVWQVMSANSISKIGDDYDKSNRDYLDKATTNISITADTPSTFDQKTLKPIAPPTTGSSPASSAPATAAAAQ
jgi:hypothetical protein